MVGSISKAREVGAGITGEEEFAAIFRARSAGDVDRLGPFRRERSGAVGACVLDHGGRSWKVSDWNDAQALAVRH